jgi:hippurate hydrolase
MSTAEIGAIIQQGVRIRHELHQHPELAWQEEWTARYLRDELDRLSISWWRCAGTGTVATLAAGAGGEHVAFRADIDALAIVEATGLPYGSRERGRMHATRWSHGQPAIGRRVVEGL